MTAKKRKHATDANTCESKRMNLRTTSSRTEHNIKRQHTPNRKRPNTFFKHLPYDVRRMIYDYMALPPFQKIRGESSRLSSGLYLSCRQAKTEMDQAAPARERAHLLEFQQQLATNSIATNSKGWVRMELPKELDTGSLPLNTVLDISFTYHRVYPDGHKLDHLAGRKDKYEVLSYMSQISEALARLKLGRLHLHFTEDFWRWLNLVRRGYLNNDSASWAMRKLLYDDFTRTNRLQGEQIIISWTIGNDSTNKSMQVMEGWKFEAVGNTSHRPYGYEFRDNVAGTEAKVFITPKPFEPGGTATSDHMSELIGDFYRMPEAGLQISRATMQMEGANIEIGDGETIPERIEWPQG
jgi:hypothetical protein